MGLLNSITSKLKNSDRKSIQLLQNIMSSLLIKGASMVISLFTMPAYIKFFNNQAVLGMWFTAISMLSWILTFDLGIGNGLRNNLVEPLINKDSKEIKRNISSAYISIGVLVLVFFIISIVIIPLLDWNVIFNTSKEIVSKDVLVFMVIMLVIGMLIRFWLNLINSIFYALQKPAIPSLLTLISSILILIFTLIGKTNDINYNIKALSIAYMVTTNIPYLFATIVLFLTKLKESKPNIKYYIKEYASKIIKLGGVFFYLQILTMIMFSTNEFLISWLVNPKEVVTFQIYNKLFSLISTFFNLALTPVWSGVTEACVKKDYPWIERLYKKLNSALLILIPFEVILIVGMPTILEFWLGGNRIDAYLPYSILFAVYNILFMKVSIDTSIIAGLGTLKIQTIALSITTLLKIILSFMIVSFWKTWISIVFVNSIVLIPYIVIEFFDIKYRLKSMSRGYVQEFNIINTLIRKITIRRIRKKYETDNIINLYGKVQLDNPNIIFGNNVSLYPGVQIWGDGEIILGNNVAIGKDTIIFAHEPMYIGDDTVIAGQCYIIDSDHGIDRSLLIREQPLNTESIFIGKDVWIGAGSKVLKGSYISNGSVIGSMSLVKGFTEPYSINVGIPAKKIKERQ